MDKTDRDLLIALQDGISLVEEPFSRIAEQIGIEPGEVIDRLQRLQEEGVIRKFRLFIRKEKIGITSNAMVVWAVPHGRIQSVAKSLSEFREVTHCYERQTVPGKWGYNLYTVIHGFERQAVGEFVKKLSLAAGVNDYLILFSEKEFVRRSSGRLEA